MPAKDWIDPQMVKTEQQIQLRQQTVKRANKSVTTMRPNPSAKQRTAALQGCGYLVSSQSVHIWGNFSQSGIHSSSKNFSPAIFWKSNVSLISQCAQYENFRSFLSFRFYVKSISGNLEVLKLPFLAFFKALNFVHLVNFSLQKVQNIICTQRITEIDFT